MEFTKEKSNMDLCDDLWKQHEPQLRKLCEYKLSSYPSEIDEVISKTYLALCEAMSEENGINDPKAWLYKTLNRQIKRKYTEMNTIKKRYVSLESVEYELMYNIDFDEVKITDKIIEELSIEIHSELTDSEEFLIKLIYEKKLKFKQIGSILGVTESAVKQQHYRLKRKIKKLAKEKIKKFQ